MHAVKLLNIKSGFNYATGAEFATPELAQEWINKVIGSEAALMPERIVSISDEYLQDDVLEVIQEEVIVSYNEVPRVDEQGNPVLDEEENQIIDQVPVTEMQDTQVRLKAQFTSEIVDITAQVASEAAQAAARQLLNSTDWMIIREADSGVLCPQEIKDQRAAARLLL